MKMFAPLMMAALFTLLPTLSIASTWQIDPDHSSIQFKVRHLMVSNVKGVFHKFSGLVDINDQDVTRSKATVTIDVASIDTGVAKRDEDLRSAAFFDFAMTYHKTLETGGVVVGDEVAISIEVEMVKK